MDRSKELVLAAESLAEECLAIGSIAKPSLTYEANFADVATQERVDAEYYQPTKREILHRLAVGSTSKVSDHFNEIKDVVTYSSFADGQFVRNHDLTDALVPFLDDTKGLILAADLRSSKKALRSGDLVISRLRSYLKEIALVSGTASEPRVASSEFVVIRGTSNAISVETLLTFFRSRAVQIVLQYSQGGSNHPRFDSKAVLGLPIPDELLAHDGAIGDLVHRSIAARQEAYRLVDEAVALVEQILMDGP